MTLSNQKPAAFDCQLDWTAFCYLSGELTDVEQASFEEQLATDQSAREALARAVELSAAATLACDELSTVSTAHPVASKTFSRTMQATSWFALATAACVAMVISYIAVKRGAEEIAGLDSGRSLPDTAWLWVQVREEMNSHPESLVDAPGSISLASPESNLLDDDYVATDVLDEAAGDVPSWLLMAVSSSAAQEAAPTEEPSGEPAENPSEEL